MRHHGVDIPNNMASERTLEDLNLSRDEVKRLGEALKDEQFRKLLCEYAEEISNPENMRKAEEEIAMMENERGMNVQFIHPEAGYVLKTTVNGFTKAFINICQNDKIDKPKSQKQTGPDGKCGLLWQIPHSFAPPKDDYDKSKKKCQVFDVVFHPDTYRMAIKNDRFKKLVEDTALDGIEHQFGVTLDKNNIKRPKLKFKGMKTATILRERKTNSESCHLSPDDFLNQMPYPYDSKTSSEKAVENEAKYSKTKTGGREENKPTQEVSKFTEPKYTIVHRSHIDMSEYRNAPDAKTSTRPKELVIKIELPLLNSASQANLDIFEKRLLVTSVSPAAYKLDLALPFPVNEDEGFAKFDKSKKLLIVTLPVLPSETQPMPFSEIKNSITEISPNNINSIAVLKQDTICSINIDTMANAAEPKYHFPDAKENGTEMNIDGWFPHDVKWVLPEYQFSQDIDTVSFVIKVKSVEENSAKLSFPQSTIAVIKFVSYGAGCFPVYYRLFIKFSDGCCISSEHSSVDVSNENLVFIILKEKGSRGLWDTFEIGVDETKLEVRQFLTQSNLQRELAELDREASVLESNMPVHVEAIPELSVVKMNESKLTIEIKPPKSKKHRPEEDEELEEDNYELPFSSEIEVIHKHPTPNLHSILKMRTPSESSEDVNGMDPESPRSEGEELSSSFGKKRSVSFSNHVDHASFKSFASVSSMTTGLKSKRRRQRKRDERRQGRIRRASEGTSSSEECLHSGCSQSLSEGEGSSERHVSRSSLSRALSDPGPSTQAYKICNKKKNGGKKGKHGNQVSDPSEITQQNDCVLDFRTSETESGDGSFNSCDKEIADIHHVCQEKGSYQVNAEEKNKKIISEIRSKLAYGDTSVGRCDSDDEDFVDAVSSLTGDFSEKMDITDKSSMDEKDTLLNTFTEDTNIKDEQNGVETMLSWEDGHNDQEHVIKCPIQFTNSLIYELDID
ncbi:Protein kintoun [Bulinus truncatus]|nr:Protein kintoun [Bulinus truncatus]